MRDGVFIKKGKQSLDELVASLALLADVEVLAGFPEDTTERKNDSGETNAYGKPIAGSGTSSITNASLAYIHDNGAPEANIPARPFMSPAMEDAAPAVEAKLAQVLRAVVTRGAGSIVVEQGLTQVGLIAKLAIQNKINEGIPPPLADSTLKARGRKGRKGAGLELLSRQHGIAPSMDFAKPLVDTGQLRNAANYVIRSRKKRGRS